MARHRRRTQSAILRLEFLEERNPPSETLYALSAPTAVGSPVPTNASQVRSFSVPTAHSNTPPSLAAARPEVASPAPASHGETPAHSPVSDSVAFTYGAPGLNDFDPFGDLLGGPPSRSRRVAPTELASAPRPTTGGDGSLFGTAFASGAFSATAPNGAPLLATSPSAGRDLFQAAVVLTASAPAAAPIDVTHPGAAQAGSRGATRNSGPNAVNQEATTAEDTPVNIYWLTYNDTSPSLATITVVGVTQGGNGSAALQPDGTVTYTPGLHWSGTDTFTYTISDGAGTATANVAVTVNHVNYPAVANPVNTSTNQNTSVAVTLSSTEVEPDPLSYVIDQSPGQGTLGPVSDNQVSYYPGGNFSGTDTFTYQADNGHGLSAPATVAVTVHPVVLGPGVAAQLTSKPMANVTVALAPDSQVTLSTSTMTFTPGNWDTAQTVALTLNPESVAEGYHPTNVALTASSADATYQGRHNAISANIIDQDGPSALPDAVTTLENTAGVFSALANDVTPQGYSLSVTGVSQPPNGSAVVNPDNTVRYTPQRMWYGTDSFRYTLSDGHGGSDQATVTVTVGAVNQPPVVVNPGSQTSAEDDKVSLQIVATKPDDSDFHYTATGLPPGLVLEAKSAVIWGWIDPTAAGTYTPSVTVDDFNGGVTTVHFTWTVTHVNHPPSLDPPTDRITHVGDFVAAAGPHAVDIDLRDNLTYGVTGLPPGVTYDPVQNQIVGTTTTAGTSNVTVSADDGHGGTDTRNFVWQVLPAGTSIPIAQFTGIDPTRNLVLVNPATPVVGSVRLNNPSDPATPVTVALAVTPTGRATIDTTLGYKLSYMLVAQGKADYIRVGRSPEATRGAEKGLVDANYAKDNYAHYVELK